MDITPHNTQECMRCHRTLSVADFPLNKPKRAAKTGRKYKLYCYDCAKLFQRENPRQNWAKTDTQSIFMRENDLDSQWRERCAREQ